MRKLLFGSLLFSCWISWAQVDWPLLKFTQVGTRQFSMPTHITHAGDGSGRIFLTEQGGAVWIIEGTNVLSSPFINVPDRVMTQIGGDGYSERGLLSIAFPSNYAAKGYFYVNYTRKPDGATVVSRFFRTADANVADTNSEQIILVVPQPFENHNGGQIAFGPDGYLYIGMGDGGYTQSDAGTNRFGDPLHNAQNGLSLLGKILRIDTESGAVPYAIPPNNPFVNATNFLPEIWAYGLRNPWRFSFDRLTGDLYIGDVGHQTWEEINFQPAGSQGGQNYGWRAREGPAAYDPPPGFVGSGVTEPVFSYGRTNSPFNVASVTGGFVARGTNAQRMNGIYIGGDFANRSMLMLKRTGTNWESRRSGGQYQMSTFGEDEGGQLYLANYFPGRIYQVEDSGQANGAIFTPPYGTVLESEFVTVTSLTPNSMIHYAYGTVPTESDPGVPVGSQIVVTNGVYYFARVFRNDLTPSDNRIFYYPFFQVGAPQFTPASSPVTNGTLIALSSATPNATIRYTVDGSDPSESSTLYSTPFSINGDVTVKAKGFRAGFTNSLISQVVYPLAPHITSFFADANGHFTFNWLSSPTKTYRVERMVNSTGWQDQGVSIVGDGSLKSFTDESTPSASETRFYRLVNSP